MFVSDILTKNLYVTSRILVDSSKSRVIFLLIPVVVQHNNKYYGFTQFKLGLNMIYLHSSRVVNALIGLLQVNEKRYLVPRVKAIL